MWHSDLETTKPAGLRRSESASDLQVYVERVTRIELAFSAWEGENGGLDETSSDGIGRLTCGFSKRRMGSDCVGRRRMCHGCAMA
jgi:hypothetical protein